uniref:CX domain-containing protein n=1 Tax=Heterorhabditis bacteriophora TaxID=37862 RepID=A0A1I7WJU6_HETBA
MADRVRPWSRWDIPVYIYIIFFLDGMGVSSYNQKQYDPIINGVQSTFIRTTLVGQKINTIDPSFYDCIYGLANSNQTITERCYKDLGCCSTGCCDNTDCYVKFYFLTLKITIIMLILLLMFFMTTFITANEEKRNCFQFKIIASHFSSKNFRLNSSLFASESDMICALFGSEVKDKYFKSKGAYGMVKLGYCKCPDFINMQYRSIIKFV